MTAYLIARNTFREATRDRVLTTFEAKGLDFQSVCLLEGGKWLDNVMHDRERGRGVELQDLSKRLAIDQLRVAPSADLLVSFCELLRGHIRREENELFQDIQQRLPKDALASTGKQIDARAIRVCL